MMKAFRHFSILLGTLNAAGELYRSAGDGRHIMFVLDDVFLGLLLVISALLFTRDTPPRRAFFAMSWGVAAGGLYGSFFGKLLSEEPINSGNLDPAFLTSFLGVFFVISLLCVFLAIRLPYGGQTP